MKGTLWYGVWAFIIEITIAVFFIPQPWIEDAINRDLDSYIVGVGLDSTMEVRNKAESWVTSNWLETGYKNSMLTLFVSTKNEKEKSKGLEKLGDPIFKFYSYRINVLTIVLFMLAIRFYYLAMWLPFMLAILIPSFIDGWLYRKIKQTNFEYSSPTWHRYGIRLLYASFLVFVATVIFPIPVPVFVIPIVMMTVALTLGVVVSNMQKRI